MANRGAPVNRPVSGWWLVPAKTACRSLAVWEWAFGAVRRWLGQRSGRFKPGQLASGTQKWPSSAGCAAFSIQQARQAEDALRAGHRGPRFFQETIAMRKLILAALVAAAFSIPAFAAQTTPASSAAATATKAPAKAKAEHHHAMKHSHKARHHHAKKAPASSAK
jgi:hypothetical protein